MKICFFGNISGALRGKTHGGAQLQVALLAKALALDNHEVVIIDPQSNESFTTPEGIKLINLPSWDKGIRGLRLFYYRLPALKALFSEQKADIYYVRTKTYLNIISYWACRKVKGRFIVARASDFEDVALFKKFTYPFRRSFGLFNLLTIEMPNNWAFNFLTKRADYLFLQHSGQQPGRDIDGKPVIFPNIFNSTPSVEIEENRSKDYFIIPGNLNVVKGSENLLNLAKVLDNSIRIVVVGQPMDNVTEAIYKELKNFKNITIMGKMPHEETIRLIAHAKCLINTSLFEGFPNVFLEAWACGVPVISLNVNPGNVLIDHSLGIFCGGSLQNMKTQIEGFEPAKYSRDRLISYVSDHHGFHSAAQKFLKLINEF